MFKIKTDHDNYMIRFLFLSTVFFSSFSFAGPLLNEDFKNEHVTPFLKRSIDPTSLGIILSGTAASLVAEEDDDRIRADWKGHQRIHKSDSSVGDILGSGAGSLAVMAGQYFWDENADHFKSHARGFVYGGISIYTLKTVFGRNRPGNSNNHQSFPSGHTAISFMTATELAYAYGWPAGIASYSVASFVAATRLSDDAHWFSDLIGGAFLGVWVGRASFYASQTATDSEVAVTNQNQLVFTPIIQHDQVGAYLSYRF